MRIIYYLLLAGINMLHSCTVFDNRQERRYMNEFMNEKDTCRNKHIQLENGVYFRVVPNTPAPDSLYYAYTFRKGKMNHYKHLLSSRYPVDSLLNLLKKIETDNLKYLMNPGVYYCSGDTLYARNYYYDTHGVTIKHLIEDSQIIVEPGKLTVIGRKEMQANVYKPANEQYALILK